MSNTAITLEKERTNFQVSEMAENLIGSEIIKLAGEVNDKIKAGEHIYNLTIGDFNPRVFPIPSALLEEIKRAYDEGRTNYPPANGIAELRQEVSRFLKERLALNYSPAEILISGGARPLIYAAYQTLVNAGDTVVFPVPSWNNNHYCHLSGAKAIMIETKPENNFMPTAEELQPHLAGASMVSLCSPLNPTGTTFTKEGLETICKLILEENKRRTPDQKPLYLLYDQIYWVLTYGKTTHFDPVTLCPELRNYTIYIDGLSKAFAATGVRVGWSFGPPHIIERMKSILSHVGAWAPMAEQYASAAFLARTGDVDNYLHTFKQQVQLRLERLYTGLNKLKLEGFPVDVIPHQAAIYLTVGFMLKGKKTAEGKEIRNTQEITSYLLEEAKLAIVPFYAFGSPEESEWYRMSVGTCRLEEVDDILSSLKKALQKLR